MNRIERRMFEDMAERISKLNDELVMSSREYDALFEEVIEFFINVKNGRDLEACVEEFEIGLSNYCDIEVVEEIGFKSNAGVKKMTDEEIVKSYINKNDAIKDKDEFYKIIKWHSEKNNISLYESLSDAYFTCFVLSLIRNMKGEIMK